MSIKGVDGQATIPPDGESPSVSLRKIRVLSCSGFWQYSFRPAPVLNGWTISVPNKQAGLNRPGRYFPGCSAR